MKIDPLESLSDFGKAAITLDTELVLFEKLVGELNFVEVNSDKGLERGVFLLKEIHSCRERMEAGMRGLAQALDAARTRNESAEKAIVDRAQSIQSRQQEADSLFTRFKALGNMVQQINTSVASLRERTGDEMTDEAQSELASHFPEIETQLGVLVGEAKKLREEALSANMKFLERNADSLRQSLEAARNRLKLLAKPPTQPPQFH